MKKLLIIIGIVVVAGIVIASTRGNLGEDSSQAENDSVPLTVEEQKELEIDKAAVVSTTKAVRYTHPRLGFSFEKPEGYTVGSLKGDDGSETLVVQPTASSGAAAKTGFQIFINPLDEAIEITPNLIKTDLPGTSVNNAQAIVLDSKGKGMMFTSNNDAFGGKSFEVWFVDGGVGGNLYQISSYAEFSATLRQIIGTWKF